MLKLPLVAILVLPLIAINILPSPKIIHTGNQFFLINNICDTFISLNENVNSIRDITELYFGITFQNNQCDFKHLLTNNQNILNLKIVSNVLNTEIKYSRSVEDEAYSLQITNQGLVSVSARTYVGYIRALDTLSQLISEVNGKYFIKELPIDIKDEPSFWYRGVMIDTSRHFLKVETILRTIDALMLNKMNILHWHIVDQESFPLYVPSAPEVTQSGAYSATEYYSVADIQKIIAYAKSRGVGIIPEIDTPAHTLSWGLSDKYRKAVLKCGKYEGQFDPTLDLTYELVEKVMRDTYELFKESLFIHFGGDEVDTSCWDSRPEIKEFMEKNGIPDYVALETYYRQRQKKIWQQNELFNYQKLRREKIQSNQNIAYWTNWDINLDVQEDDIVHWWGNTEQLQAIKDKKNQIILSNYDLLYLDIGYEGVYGNRYGDFTTWKDIYLKFNPFPEDIQGLVIGAVSCLWGEVNNDSTHFNKMFPRTSVLAHKLWNASIDKSIKLSDFIKKLSAMEHRLRSQGIQSAPVTSDFCSQNTEVCFPS